VAPVFEKFIRDPKRVTVKLLKKKARPAFNRVIAHYSEIGDPPTFDPALFPFSALLEANWRVIRGELDGVLAHRHTIPAFRDISPDQYRISRDESWRTFWLRGFGGESALARAMCPRTCGLLDAVPGVETALFSILDPGTYIPPHRGVYKGIINYHLGLIVPQARDRCRIRVGDAVLLWEEGKSLVFDDTNRHEVWNETQEQRVVLMIQFRRPLRAPGEQLSGLFLRALRLTPYVTRARKNQVRWERRFADALATRRGAPVSRETWAPAPRKAETPGAGGHVGRQTTRLEVGLRSRYTTHQLTWGRRDVVDEEAEGPQTGDFPGGGTGRTSC
jgi:beta-hydroxylase